MRSERVDQLWFRFLLDREMSPAEMGELLAAMDGNPELRDRLLDDAEVHGLLSAQGARNDQEGVLARAVSDQLAAERDKAGFVDRLKFRMEKERLLLNRSEATSAGGAASPSTTKRFRSTTRRSVVRTSRNQSHSFWIAAVAAAAVFIAITVVLNTSGSRPVEPKPEKIVREQKPKAPVAPVQKTPVPPAPRSAPVKPNPDAKPPVVPEPESKPASPDARDPKAEELRRKALEAFSKPPEAGKPPAPPKERTPEPVPLKPPSPKPEPQNPSETPKKTQEPAETRAVIARVEPGAGQVVVLRGGREETVTQAGNLLSGDSLETRGEGSRAVLTYTDGTRVDLAMNTKVENLVLDKGKRIFVARGAVEADVSRQPRGEAMVFQTPDGDAQVLGTTLRIVVNLDRERGTRLEVTEGRVRFKRKIDGKSVLVRSGYYTVAATGVQLNSRKMFVTERFDRDALGAEWTVRRPEMVALSNGELRVKLENAGAWVEPTPGIYGVRSYPVGAGLEVGVALRMEAFMGLDQIGVDLVVGGGQIVTFGAQPGALLLGRTKEKAAQFEETYWQSSTGFASEGKQEVRIVIDSAKLTLFINGKEAYSAAHGIKDVRLMKLNLWAGTHRRGAKAGLVAFDDVRVSEIR